MIAEVIQSLAALSTLVVAWLTWMMVRVMLEQRMEAAKPVLVPYFDDEADDIDECVYIRNIGSGPALDASVDIELTSTQSGGTVDSQTTVAAGDIGRNQTVWIAMLSTIAAGERDKLPLSQCIVSSESLGATDEDDWANSAGTLGIDYTDLFGNHWHSTTTIWLQFHNDERGLWDPTSASGLDPKINLRSKSKIAELRSVVVRRRTRRRTT